jgi:hypothetical protein
MVGTFLIALFLHKGKIFAEDPIPGRFREPCLLAGIKGYRGGPFRFFAGSKNPKHYASGFGPTAIALALREEGRSICMA